MNAVFDIIIITIIFFCTAFGYKNGFVRTVMNVLSFAIAFFTARAFAPQLSDYLYSNYIRANFVSAAANKIEGFVTKNIDLNSLAHNVNPPDNFVNMLKGYGFDLTHVQDWLKEAGANGAESMKNFVAVNLAEPLAKQISYFLAFIIILVLALILLKIAVGIIDSLVKLPGLNFVNTLGGILLGIVYGTALCYIFVFLASYGMPYLDANGTVNSWTDIRNDTIFFKWFYENSPLDYILGLV